MPRSLETGSRTDLLLDATQRIFVRDGVRGLTLRAVAAESGISPASLVHHFGGRERMDRVLGRLFAHRLADEFKARSRARGLAVFLPDDRASREEWRTWLAWWEVGRGQPALAEALAGARDEHRELIAWMLEPTPDETDLDLVQAVLEGLATACSQPVDPLPPERARAALARLRSLRSTS